MDPTLISIAEKYTGRLKIAKVNHDENPELIAAYRIEGLPTLIVFKNGQEQVRLVGGRSESELSGELDSLLAQNTE